MPCAALLEQAGFAFNLQMLATVAVGIGIYKMLKHRLVRERSYITHDGIVCAATPCTRFPSRSSGRARKTVYPGPAIQ